MTMERQNVERAATHYEMADMGETEEIFVRTVPALQQKSPAEALAV
jgi:hypothetical protein